MASTSGAWLLGVVLWVVCLNGGTLALNSAYDRDEGDIAYLRQPPPPPRHLAPFGLALWSSGLLLASLLPGEFQAAYAVCLVLSVLYSVPPFRLKAVPGADWLINMVGFGTLTPYAGWAATGLPLQRRARAWCSWLLSAVCGAVSADPDLPVRGRQPPGRPDAGFDARGKRSLLVSLVAAPPAYGLFALAGGSRAGGATTAGVGCCWPSSGESWGVLLLTWIRRHGSMGMREHQRGMYQALAAWALTDVVVVIAWAT